MKMTKRLKMTGFTPDLSDMSVSLLNPKLGRSSRSNEKQESVTVEWVAVRERRNNKVTELLMFH